MLTGTMPYPPPEDGNPSSVLRDIRTTQLNFPAELSGAVVDLLKRMLEPEVKDRIRLFEVRTHPWLIEHRCPVLNQNSSFESLPSMSSSPSLSSFDDLVSPREGDSEKENKDNSDKDGTNSPPASDKDGTSSPPAPMSAPTSPVLARMLAPSAHSRGDLEPALLSQKDV
jgi:serine/threonine protein kinase